MRRLTRMMTGEGSLAVSASWYVSDLGASEINSSFPVRSYQFRDSSLRKPVPFTHAEAWSSDKVICRDSG